jgi:hypothetical protein
MNLSTKGGLKKEARKLLWQCKWTVNMTKIDVDDQNIELKNYHHAVHNILW